MRSYPSFVDSFENANQRATIKTSINEGAIDKTIETKGLTKRYGHKAALDNLDITVYKGEVLGYLGPNGAGKTTTIRLLLGLIKPTSGTATIEGQSVWQNPAELHKDIAYVPGETSYWPNMTGKETLQF